MVLSYLVHRNLTKYPCHESSRQCVPRSRSCPNFYPYKPVSRCRRPWTVVARANPESTFHLDWPPMKHWRRRLAAVGITLASRRSLVRVPSRPPNRRSQIRSTKEQADWRVVSHRRRFCRSSLRWAAPGHMGPKVIPPGRPGPVVPGPSGRGSPGPARWGTQRCTLRRRCTSNRRSLRTWFPSSSGSWTIPPTGCTRSGTRPRSPPSPHTHR